MAGVNRTTGKATDLITFSRASGGTALRKISYGSELVTNGGFDSADGWTLGTGWTISGGVVSHAGASGNLDQAMTITAGVYLVTFTVSNQTTGNIAVQFTGGATVTLYNAIGVNGNYTLSGVSAGNGNLRIVGGTNFDGTIDNISVKEVLFDQPDGTLTLFNHPTNIPRIEYAADVTVKGLLIEESRTNLVTYSEDFSTVWNVSGGSVLSDQTTAPDGANTADLIPSGISLYKGFYTTSGVTFTHSVYVKAYGSNATIRLQTGTGFSVRGTTTLNLETLTVTEGSGVVENVGDGWYRFSTQVEYSGAGDNNIYLQPSNGIYLWGMQVEQGAFPTSYMPTSGATATRAADIASISVDSFGYRQDAGTVVVETKTLADQAGAKRMFSFDNGASNADSMQFAYIAGGLSAYFEVRDDAVVQVSGVPSGAISSSAFAKSAVSYKANDFAASVNSNTVFSDTSGTVPTSQTQLQIGGFIGGNQLNGHIKSIAYYPRRLSNAQLQELTA